MYVVCMYVQTGAAGEAKSGSSADALDCSGIRQVICQSTARKECLALISAIVRVGPGVVLYHPNS